MGLPFVLIRQRVKFHLEHGRGIAWVAVIGTCWRTTGLVHVVSIPVDVATTIPPTGGWVGFGQSVHGELRAYGTLFNMLQRKWKRYLTISLSPRPCQ
jgi:hypothetical protein